MKGNFERCLAILLKEEGGYSANPADPGGVTNLGVTKRTWEDYTGRKVTADEMRALTPDAVAPLYRKGYWQTVRGDSLPAGVDLCVFDCAVNSGPGQAGKFLQRAVGATADGVIGDKTLALVAATDPEKLIDLFCDQRLVFMGSLPTWHTFGTGWSARVGRIRDQAKALLNPR